MALTFGVGDSVGVVVGEDRRRATINHIGPSPIVEPKLADIAGLSDASMRLDVALALHLGVGTVAQVAL